MGRYEPVIFTTTFVIYRESVSIKGGTTAPENRHIHIPMSHSPFHVQTRHISHDNIPKMDPFILYPKDLGNNYKKKMQKK